jgi:hypothetical protein
MYYCVCFRKTFCVKFCSVSFLLAYRPLSLLTYRPVSLLTQVMKKHLQVSLS